MQTSKTRIEVFAGSLVEKIKLPLSFYCPSYFKHSFKKNSALKTYLETHCLGWVTDPLGKYTVNYIAIVLLADFRHKNLYDPIFPGIIRCTPELSKVFDIDELALISLRAAILEHLEGEQDLSMFPDTSSYCIFWCAHELEAVARKYLPYGLSENKLNRYLYCCG